MSAVLLRPIVALFFPAISAGPAPACDLKLLLTWDVSPSMSAQEYALQRLGTAQALLDPTVQEAILMLPDGVAVAIMQWAGPSEQQVSLPWTLLKSEWDIASFALKIGALSDPFDARNGTAVGASLKASSVLLDMGPACARTIIDISTDGVNNIGIPPDPEVADLNMAGVVINAIVLPASEIAILAEGEPIVFYEETVAIAPGAFVISADSYEDYWKALRMKLLRELAPNIAMNSEQQSAPIRPGQANGRKARIFPIRDRRSE